MNILAKIDSLSQDIYSLLTSGVCRFTTAGTSNTFNDGADKSLMISQLLVLSRTDFGAEDLIDYVKKSQEMTVRKSNEHHRSSHLLVGEAMQCLSGKWKLQIVSFLLQNGRTRFTELQRGIGGISPRVLSKELQDLQASDIVARKVLDAKLIAVDYELTELGGTLEYVIRSIENWACQYKKYQ